MVPRLGCALIPAAAGSVARRAPLAPGRARRTRGPESTAPVLPIGTADAAPNRSPARPAPFEEQHDEPARSPVAAAGTPEARTIHAEIKTIAESLHGSERHHEQEEHVLFPALEERGVAMPPRVMHREHDELRRWKKRLLAVASEAAPDSEPIAEPVGTLAAMLRDHIHKENEVLYPMALSVIEAGAWEQLNRQADKIGACCCNCGKDGGHKD